MVPENKQNRRYKQINFIGGGNPERVSAVLRSISKEAFADSFQKLYERCQPCVEKDGDYSEDQKESRGIALLFL
jgi:hypothetical protein